MRIDMLLNKLCLTKTRNIAKKACDKNLVWINGKLVKASHEVRAGDLICFNLYSFKHEIEILELPVGNVAKKEVTNYYKLLDKSALE